MTATGSDQFNGCGLLSCRLQLMNRTFALFQIFAFNAATSTVAVKFTVRVALRVLSSLWRIVPIQVAIVATSTLPVERFVVYCSRELVISGRDRRAPGR